MTAARRPPAPRKAAARAAESFLPVALLTIGVGIALRSAGIAVFLWIVPQPAVVHHCLIGLVLHLAACALVVGGRVQWAIFVSGADFVLIPGLTPRFGTGADLYLYTLIPPILVLTYVRWPFRNRVILSLLPLAIFVIFQLLQDDPHSTGLLSPGELRFLATVNVVAVFALCIASTVRAVQIAERSRQRAEGLAEMRSRLIDDMSHELRTPVSIVLTAAQAALGNERSGESYRATLGVIERQSRSLGRLMARMLEMSRAERAELAVFPADDLVGSVRRIVDGFREVAEVRSISLVLEADPVVLLTDGAVLQVVVGNLLANAIRFSPDGSRVEVRVVADGPASQITVRDHGPGIAPEDLPHIFERYWRADKARSRLDGHFGLGLAIARRYARLLGATVEAESPPGRGAAFAVRW